MADHPSPQIQALPPEFFALLERQHRQAAELLAILEQELQALSVMDLTQLVHLSRKKECQVARLQKLDETFQAVGAGLLQDKDRGTVSLSRLAAATGGEDRQRVREMRAILLRQRQDILERNRFNKKLASDIQGYLQDAISLITNTAAGRPVYSGKGKAASSKGPVLISREI